MKPIQPVERALMLLEALGRHHMATLDTLAKDTGLPKPSLVRLLDTLIATGHVQRISRRAGYVRTARVLRLSAGYSRFDRVVELARAPLDGITALHRWPVGLATFDQDAMLVRYETRHRSPLSTGTSYLNRRPPMLMSALGRVYLAFCPAEERRMILRILAASTRPHDRMANDREMVDRLLRRVRRQGYATLEPLPGSLAAGLAIPVMGESEVLAAITLRYFGSIMTEREAAARYLPAMREAAEAISAALRADTTAQRPL